MDKNAVILLSGGLDSALNLAIAKENIAYALTIDYGQRAREKELLAAANLAEYYGTQHKIIKIDFLSDLAAGALLGKGEVPSITEQQLNNDLEYQQQTAEKVWVPNRNGLLINIAGAFAEGRGLKEIIVGFNAEEAVTFSDNSKEFIDAVNSSLSFSTRTSVKVKCSTIKMTKTDMLRKAMEIGLPLNMVWSCYYGGEKPCLSCESCMRFRRAYRNVTGEDYAN